MLFSGFSTHKKRSSWFGAAIGFVVVAFVTTSLYIPQVLADQMPMPLMPVPGFRVHLSPNFTPAIIRGMIIDPKNPFAFSFLVDPGDSHIPADQQREYFQKLIKYFLAAMTIAEDKQWVNLSPYERNRIIDTDFGKTEMGRDLLAQDYMLKQITASLLYPEEALGKKFWKEVYAQAAQKYGTTQIPVNTFNKVWILPDTASVYEKDNTVLIVQSHLKVMLEEDYLSLQKHAAIAVENTDHPVDVSGVNKLGSQLVRQIILPAIEKEVNEGKNFAQLRQIYHGMVLATWYKQALRKSILTQIYANKNKVKGVDLTDPTMALQKVYKQYLKAFKKGAYNYIKEEIDPVTQQMIPRKYFSGGFLREKGNEAMITIVGLKRAEVLLSQNPDVRRRGFFRWLAVGVALADSSRASAQYQTNVLVEQELLNAPRLTPHRLADHIAPMTVAPPLPADLKNRLDQSLGKTPEARNASAKPPQTQATQVKHKENEKAAPKPSLPKQKVEEVIKTIKQQSPDSQFSLYMDMLTKNTIFNYQINPVSTFSRINSFFVILGQLYFITIDDAGVPNYHTIVGNTVQSLTNNIPKQLIVVQENGKPRILGNEGLVAAINALGDTSPMRLTLRVNPKLNTSADIVTQGNSITVRNMTAIAPWKIEVNIKGDIGYMMDYVTKEDPKEITEVDLTTGETTNLEFNVARPELQKALNDFAQMTHQEIKARIQLPGQDFTKGGIDLNSANLAMTVKKDGKGVPLPLALQDPAMISAPGFIPIVTGIRSAEDLPILKELESLATP